MNIAIDVNYLLFSLLLFVIFRTHFGFFFFFHTHINQTNGRFNLTVDHLVDLVVRIARERDKFQANWITQITPTVNDTKFSAAETSTNQTATVNNDQNHQAVEVADLKSKLRKLRQDL